MAKRVTKSCVRTVGMSKGTNSPKHAASASVRIGVVKLAGRAESA